MERTKLEKNGLKFIITENQYEILGPEGVIESGSMITSGKKDTEIFEIADKHFVDYIKKHSVEENEHDSIIKRVAYDKARKDYIQLQAVKREGTDYYIVQEYNSDMVFLREHETEVWYNDDIKKYLLEKYDIQKGLTAKVFKSSRYGDCTNGGISSERDELYILGCKTSPFYPTDLRQCVEIVKREVIGEQYVNAKPVVYPNRWYMAGGNFLHTSDSRFRELTGISYAISIHDRYEKN